MYEPNWLSAKEHTTATNNQAQSWKRIMLLLVVCSLLSGGLGAGIIYMTMGSPRAIVANQELSTFAIRQVAARQLLELDTQRLLESERNTIAVVEAVLPGVVLVSTTSLVYQGSDPFFGSFFGSPRDFQPREVQGNGSGFIYDTLGHIVTNYHVIDDAASIMVTLHNGNSYAATIVGTDPLSDLAVLRIEAPARELVPLPLADSDQVLVGQKAIAIGSPLASSVNDRTGMGLHRSPTVTQGIVSAKDRAMTVPDTRPGAIMGSGFIIEGLVQTDAAINPGNSGGPLLNSAGEVIGVNTAKITGTQGMGFAIPSSLVRRNVEDLIAGRPIGRPFIGINYIMLDDTSRRLGERYSSLGLPTERGALVTSVVSGSPAEAAGLRGGDREMTISNDRFILGGDIIVRFGGAPVSGSNLPALLSDYFPGDEVAVSIIREGRELDLTLVLGVRAP